jgi:hypothetical protein
MGTRFPYEDRVAGVNAAPPGSLARTTRRKASTRVGMVFVRVALVARRVLVVDSPEEIVRTSRGVVRSPVVLGTRPCELVGREALKASGADRLVAASVGMGAIACAKGETPVVNVGARALLAANAERMVSATSVLAGNTVNDAYVLMHAVWPRMIAADKSSIPCRATGVCDGVSWGDAGDALERASKRAPGAPRPVDTADGRRQHVSNAAECETRPPPTVLVSVTTRDYT